MNKDDFLRRLEQLLGNISPEERADAMAYYRSYFEDAGIENETSILEELESPEKVAQSILKDAGVENGAAAKQQEQPRDSYAYSNGYRSGSAYGNNSSYENNNVYGNNSSYENNNVYGNNSSYENNNVYGNYNNYGGGTYAEKEKQKHKNTAMVVGIVAVVLLSPIWGTILAAILSVIAGLFCALFGVALAVVVVMGSMLIVGFVLIVAGCASVGSGTIAAGIGVIGAGFLVLALGILALIATVWVCGAFLPWACRGITDGCKSMWNKRKGKKLL